MLDVHVPHKTEHTWTDFFIHIGTIAVGPHRYTRPLFSPSLV